MSQRILALDILRGLLLVNIMFNHVPGPHNDYTSQPFGFVSSAEGFFLISGYLIGSISARRASEGKPLFDRLWKRIKLIYLAHILALVTVLLVIGLGLGHLGSYYNITHPYQENPTAATFAALLLLYQPPLLDILPLYVIFMAMTPGIWWLARHFHWLTVFALSASLWLWAQFHTVNATLAFLNPWLPVIHAGSFNIFAWQWLWVCSVGLGVWHWQNRAQGFRIPWWLTTLAVGVAGFFFAWRMPWIPVNIDLNGLWLLLDKWMLAPLRVLNLLAMLVIAISFAPLFHHLLKPLRFLTLLGRHSLLVFSVHSVLGLLLAGWVEMKQPAESLRLLLLAGEVSFIFLWAWYLDKKPNRSD